MQKEQEIADLLNKKDYSMPKIVYVHPNFKLPHKDKKCKVCQLRREKYWTQEETGEKLGVSGATISRWEKKDKNPEWVDREIKMRFKI